MIRLYRAACEYLEALTDNLRAEHQPEPEGATSQVEHSHTFTTMPEMHANHRGTELEDDNGTYQIGFRSTK